MANMSANLPIPGRKDADIAPLWLAAPLTGLCPANRGSPVTGHGALDRPPALLSRRALLSSLALIAMPNSGVV